MNGHNTNTWDLSNVVQSLMNDLFKEKIELILEEEIKNVLMCENQWE